VVSERLVDSPVLHVEVDGAGPLVCLTHGFGGSARNLRPQVRVLAERYRAACFDLRGHGRSEAPADPEAYVAERLAADFGRVLDHLREARAVVGGISLGAALAVRFALAHPDRVRGLVLASFPPGAEAGRQRGWARDFADAIEREGLEAAGERYAWGSESGFDPGTRKLVRAGFLEHAPHALAHILRRVLAVQPDAAALGAALAPLALPVLVVAGGADRVSRRSCEALAGPLPSARLVVVEGAGHVVNLAARDPFNRVLLEFLDSLPG
jgi:pimeloyl-ACP methyl ester carboxylesterase